MTLPPDFYTVATLAADPSQRTAFPGDFAEFLSRSHAEWQQLPNSAPSSGVEALTEFGCPLDFDCVYDSLLCQDCTLRV